MKEAVKRLKQLLIEAKETLGMVHEIRAKINLYSSITDPEKLAEVMQPEFKLREDLYRYLRRFEEIEQETKDILARIDGEV